MNNKFFPSNFLFISIMILGTMLSLSSSHWLTMWMGLELNLMSFLPLMNIKGKMLEAEASMKYFIIQSMSSSMLIFGSIIMYIYNLTWYSMFNNMMSILILLSLTLKLGGAPMHFWLPNISKQMPWSILFLLLTWQKLAPLFMLSLMNSNFMMIMTVSILSTLMGSMMALNQTNLQLIITYSSISHLGWMLSMIIFNNSLTLFYFINYIIISIPLLYLINSQLGNHLFMLGQKNNINMIIISLILSLAGLPPLLGFMSKLIMLISLINMKLYILPMFLLLGTLISLYFYLNMSLMLMIKSYSMFKTKKNNQLTNPLISLNLMSSFIIYPIIIMFMN
uniref:NADH-ubiquinone oxidoreductase chain 2 n=1 Tax=Eumandya parva TaxID=2302672 RepID=A0A8F5CDQ3_9MOLL|nr:NADH dehydrogenase subunit 2 [Eumandya parva]QXJ42063.1 NADH dehydrogenase subunit 2 [Eumandya parva]